MLDEQRLEAGWDRARALEKLDRSVSRAIDNDHNSTAAGSGSTDLITRPSEARRLNVGMTTDTPRELSLIGGRCTPHGCSQCKAATT